MHLGGKIEVNGRVAVKTRDDLSMAYTPGVARVCMAIHDDPEKVYNLTIKQNTVAVVTDGSAVLGLGDIGPDGRAARHGGQGLIFKAFAGVDAFPIALDTKDVDEIVRTVKAIAPVFGGINLEDISAPRCFEIEERLQRELDIPVFHDDQHGTAVVVLAALINALKVVNKKLNEVKIVFTGAGASAIATAKLLMLEGARHIIALRPRGRALPRPHGEHEPDEDVVRRAHQPRGPARHGERRPRSAPTSSSASPAPAWSRSDDLGAMNREPIVFAMANPTPEIMPEEAGALRARHGHRPLGLPEPDQQLVRLPRLLPRPARRARAQRQRRDEARRRARARQHRVATASSSEEYITPSMFDPRVVPAVAAAVADAAVRTGVARRRRG